MRDYSWDCECVTVSELCLCVYWLSVCASEWASYTNHRQTQFRVFDYVLFVPRSVIEKKTIATFGIFETVEDKKKWSKTRTSFVGNVGDSSLLLVRRLHIQSDNYGRAENATNQKSSQKQQHQAAAAVAAVYRILHEYLKFVVWCVCQLFLFLARLDCCSWCAGNTFVCSLNRPTQFSWFSNASIFLFFSVYRAHLLSASLSPFHFIPIIQYEYRFKLVWWIWFQRIFYTATYKYAKLIYLEIIMVFVLAVNDAVGQLTGHHEIIACQKRMVWIKHRLTFILKRCMLFEFRSNAFKLNADVIYFICCGSSRCVTFQCQFHLVGYVCADKLTFVYLLHVYTFNECIKILQKVNDREI